MIPRLWSFRRKLSNTQLPRYFHSGVFNQHVKPNVPFYYSGVTKYGRKFEGRVVFRYSTMSEPTHESPPDIEILTFFKSTVDEHEGPNHCWLNKLEESKMHFGKDNLFLVLAGAFPRDSLGLGSNHILLFERVKYLQRRYPQLCVFGFQCDTSNCSISSQTHIVHAIMKEYLTFPILLTNKNFPVIKDEGCYLLFKDFKSPMLYYQEGTDIGTISRGEQPFFSYQLNFVSIEELGLLKNENSEAVKELKVFGAKQLDLIKEPCVFPFQNFLLHYPGCISVDEDGNRLFLSDSNHHRIIIFDGNGKILDCIGSSPGFEDGEFESAKLLRPAASLYHAFEDCLYFVDSELSYVGKLSVKNHAIRRADIGGRTIETIYPPFRTGNNISGIWNWVLDKLGIGREVAPKSKELDLEPLLTPWHLMKSRENNLLIVSRSFHTLWIMDPASGRIEKVVTGYPKILEICGQMITEKVSLLKQISKEKFEQEVYSSTVEGFPIVSLVSSLGIWNHFKSPPFKLRDPRSATLANVSFGEYFCWSIAQPGTFFTFFSFSGNTCQRVCPDHLQRFSVLPGGSSSEVSPASTCSAKPLSAFGVT
ncbi:hypothetical protein IFM89_038848 [Coptis chinensis]|uniref:Uncharacterized protein n=1 Tax=Coptis chinensis TaxID=261450 RepID=A0A835LXV6_9MAGN|nr:hypothetical protein IFM89_038848 [Coptis chinensis]